jgi:hypothetical protein
MEEQKVKRIKVLLERANRLDKLPAMIEGWTNGRTKDIQEMTLQEGNLMYGRIVEEDDKAREKMRGKIWHYLCLYGMTINGEADKYRINEFIKNIGSNNPKKKMLWYLNRLELVAVLNQVEQMVGKSIVNKSQKDK